MRPVFFLIVFMVFEFAQNSTRVYAKTLDICTILPTCRCSR